MPYVVQTTCPHCPHTHDVYVEHPSMPAMQDEFCYVCPLTGQSITGPLREFRPVEIIPAGEIVALQV